MIIFLYGEDTFRSSQKVIEIKNKFLSSDESGSGLSVFDCTQQENSIRHIVDTINTPNLLAPKRLVICKNLISAYPSDEQKKMLEYLKKKKELGEDKDVVAIFWEEEKVKKNNALYKFLVSKESGVKSQNFEKLTGTKLETWALRMVKEISPNTQISGRALSKLISYCDGDNFLLSREIEKLIAYAGEEMISENDVDLLVKANLSTNIFQMVEALGANNKKEALSLFHSHLQNGDDPFYLLSMFFYQFRNMLKISDFAERGMSQEYEIARETKLHPYVVKKTLSQLRNFSFEKLKEIYGKLEKLDSAVKTGKIEIKLGMDKFIVEL
jgi:DNA polymerase-3 subunit delta